MMPPAKGGSVPRTTLQILLALLDGPCHGYGIKLDVERRTRGAINLGSGTLYEAIQRLFDLGWIEEVPPPPTNSGGRSRRFYTLTDTGREALEKELGAMDEILQYARQKDVLDDMPGH